MDEDTVQRLVDIAWAGGLFEGEGNIQIDEKHRGGDGRLYLQVHLRLGMTDFDSVEKFYRIVGVGHLRDIVPREAHHKAQLQWFTSSRSGAREVLELILCHLGKRRSLKAMEAIVKLLNFDDRM